MLFALLSRFSGLLIATLALPLLAQNALAVELPIDREFISSDQILGDAAVKEILKPVAEDCHPWRADLIVGLPLSLRLQRQIDGPFWWEIGASVYIIVPAVYTGLRFDIAPAKGKEDSFHIRPGVGVALTPGNLFDRWETRNSVGWLTGDVDFVWRHDWSNSISGEFGIKVGAVVPLIRDSFPMPRLAFIFGVQF